MEECLKKAKEIKKKEKWVSIIVSHFPEFYNKTIKGTPYHELGAKDVKKIEENSYCIVSIYPKGLILLKQIVNPEILYKIFHSDGIGNIWKEHYDHFFKLIKKYHRRGKILEVGAGQGKLIELLLSYYLSGVEVVDPPYEGPKENVKVHKKLFTKEYAKEMGEEFDTIVSSHTLEHFTEFNEYTLKVLGMH